MGSISMLFANPAVRILEEGLWQKPLNVIREIIRQRQGKTLER
jgi:hypothetical protein